VKSGLLICKKTNYYAFLISPTNVRIAPIVTNEYTIFARILIVVTVLSIPVASTLLVTTSGNTTATRLRSNQAYNHRFTPPTTKRINIIQLRIFIKILL